MSSAVRSITPPDSGSSADTALDSRYSWYIVFVLLLAYTCSFLDRMIISLMVDPIKKTLHITDFQFSLLQGFAFAVLYGLLGIPCGRLIDRFSRKYVMAAGITLWSAMTGACGLAMTYGQLFAARVGVGIGEATLSPGAYSILSDLFSRAVLPKAMSVYSFGIVIGSGLALMFGGPVVDYFASDVAHTTLPFIGAVQPWQLALLAISLLGVPIAVAVLSIREPRRRGTAGGHDIPMSEVVRFVIERRGLFTLFLLGFAVMTMYSHGVGAWTPAYFIRVHHWSASEVGVYLGLTVLIAGVVGMYAAGLATQYLIQRGVEDALIRIPAIIALCIVPLGVIAPLVQDSRLSLLLFGAIQLFAMAPWGLAATVIQVIAPNRMRGQLSAFYLFSINIVGLAFGPSIVAGLSDGVFSGANAIGHALSATALICLPVAAFLLFSSLSRFRTSLLEAGD